MKNLNVNNSSNVNKSFRLRNGFTLIELLAVIIILALILVIAVPKILSVIDSAKRGTLESSAKMIASMAEKSKVQNQVLGKTELITCETVSKLNDIDYKCCYIDFVENTAYVTIKGSNKFEGMFICEGTKNNSKVTDKCPNQRVNVTLDLNGGNIVNDITGVYREGTILNIEEPTRENYKFIKWDIISGNGKLEDNKFTVGSDNAIISAVWEINIIKLNVISNGGTITQSFQEEYMVGSQIELENPTKTGYTFEGWSVSGKNASINNNILIMGVEDTTITANFIPNTYTITYNLNGGSVSENPTSYTIETNTFTLNNPTKTGYTFTGWTGSNGSTPNKNVTISKGSIENKTYTANWKSNNTIPVFTYTGSYQIVDDNDNVITSSTGNWKIRFLTGGTLKFTDLGGAEDGIDVFCLGGGGGAGGYTRTKKGVSVNLTTTYTITIGAGGGQATAGGTTSAFGVSAAGGNGARSTYHGGNGGSCGGSVHMNGGSNGGNGGTWGIDPFYPAGGSGQGTTTREFGESSGKLYAGGGGGGAVDAWSGGSGGSGGGASGGIEDGVSGNGRSAAANTGGGGGGAYGSAAYPFTKGGSGGSGIVVIRNKR